MFHYLVLYCLPDPAAATAKEAGARMSFLKTGIGLLFYVVSYTALAQDNMGSVNDTATLFHANKADHSLVLNPRTIPDTTLQHLYSDDAFWYANTSKKKKLESDSKQSSFLQWMAKQTWLFKALWFLMIGSAGAVLLLFLIKSDVRLFHKKATPIEASEEDALPDDLFTIDYEKEQQIAASQHDFRMAVRYQYLQVLALLANNNTIEYKREFTNRDYLQQLQGTTQYAAFKKLTQHFEYAWYGKFAISPPAFEAIEKDFTTFKSSMGI